MALIRFLLPQTLTTHLPYLYAATHPYRVHVSQSIACSALKAQPISLLSMKAAPQSCQVNICQRERIQEVSKRLAIASKETYQPNADILEIVKTKNLSALREALAKGKNCNTPSLAGLTPLDFAVETKFVEALPILKQHHAQTGQEIYDELIAKVPVKRKNYRILHTLLKMEMNRANFYQFFDDASERFSLHRIDEQGRSLLDVLRATQNERMSSIVDSAGALDKQSYKRIFKRFTDSST